MSYSRVLEAILLPADGLLRAQPRVDTMVTRLEVRTGALRIVVPAAKRVALLPSPCRLVERNLCL